MLKVVRAVETLLGVTDQGIRGKFYNLNPHQKAHNLFWLLSRVYLSSSAEG